MDGLEIDTDKIKEQLEDPSITPGWFDEMLRRLAKIM